MRSRLGPAGQDVRTDKCSAVVVYWSIGRGHLVVVVRQVLVVRGDRHVLVTQVGLVRRHVGFIAHVQLLVHLVLFLLDRLLHLRHLFSSRLNDRLTRLTTLAEQLATVVTVDVGQRVGSVGVLGVF